MVFIVTTKKHINIFALKGLSNLSYLRNHLYTFINLTAHNHLVQLGHISVGSNLCCHGLTLVISVEKVCKKPGYQPVSNKTRL